MCVLLMIAIVRKALGVRHTLATTLQILSVSVFEKAPLHQVLAESDRAMRKADIDKRLVLSGLYPHHSGSMC